MLKNEIKLAEDKLASSGLTMEDAKQLSIVPLASAQVPKLHSKFPALPCLKINYLGTDKKPLLDQPKGDPFYRLRFLESAIGFAELAGKKPLRYVQAPNTRPVAYFPANYEWQPMIKDASRTLIITEGELKAAKACKEGFATIGLGGVYNWRSYKLGITWLDSLNCINWVRRKVHICFDSDYTTNPQVCYALKELADELQARGAFVNLVTLPEIEGFKKTGLDDFLTFGGSSANESFEQMLVGAEPLGLAQPLWSLNERYVYVRDPGLIIDQQSRFKTAPGAFKEHLEATANYQERALEKNGELSFKPVSAACAWLCWPLRAEATKLTYQPGAERFVMLPDVTYYNIWPGWGVTPSKGDVTPFLKLVDHLFTNAEQEAKDWFLRWCAYPLQFPGAKLFSSAVFHGIKHGTGKSLIGYTLGDIYGKNFAEIGQNDLHGSFNEWAEGKQFILGDDVTGSNKRQDADFLKKMITQRELRVNAKYIPSYVVPDCINYFFTANHPDSFFLEDDDRRFFIHEVQVLPLPEKFYLDYKKWLDAGGASALFHWFLNLDLKSWNPAAPAFKTAAKERMINNVRSDLAGWVRNLQAVPDHVLKVGEIVVPKDLFTNKELLQFYDPEGRTGCTANGLGRELARAGIQQVCAGKPIRLPDGSQSRYYALRNMEHWLAANSAAVVEHLTGKNSKKVEKKRKY